MITVLRITENYIRKQTSIYQYIQYFDFMQCWSINNLSLVWIGFSVNYTSISTNNPSNLGRILVNHSKFTLNNFVGYYCDGLGLVAETGQCTAGYYCPEGQTTGAPTAFVCPTGSYCPTGSALPNICPRGKQIFISGSKICIEKFLSIVTH